MREYRYSEGSLKLLTNKNNIKAEWGTVSAGQLVHFQILEVLLTEDFF